MEKQYLNLELKASDNGELTIVATDETLDRYNEVVPIDAWDMRNYKKNPVLLVNHDYKVENIVGRAKNLKITDGKMTFTPDFHSITQLARDVAEMVKQNVLNTVSVGFLNHQPMKDGEKVSQELLEISFVPVPANPNALVLAAKSVNAAEKKEIEKWVEKELDTEENSDGSETEPTEEEKKPEEGAEEGKEPQTTDEIQDKDLAKQIAQLTAQLAEVKEGRVLSGKNRTLIENGLAALQQAALALEELLKATDSSTGKAADCPKGRETEEEQKGKKTSPIVRALQAINRDTNSLLRDLK